MNRDLDLDIVKTVYGWKPCKVPPDCDGNNEGIVYTSTGELPEECQLPPKGRIFEGFFAPSFSSRFSEALKLVRRVELKTPADLLPPTPEGISKMCLEHFNQNR